MGPLEELLLPKFDAPFSKNRGFTDPQRDWDLILLNLPNLSSKGCCR